MLKQSLTAALLALSLSGCSIFNTFGTDNFPTPAALPASQPSPQLGVVWRTSVGDGSGSDYLRLSPALANGWVYTADVDGTVRATDAQGHKVFRTELGHSGHSGVGTNGSVLAVVDDHAQLYNLSAQNGRILWQAGVSNSVLAAPTVTASTTYVKTIDGTVAAYANLDGKLLWSYSHPGPTLVLRASSSVVVVGNVVYSGFVDGTVVALNAANGDVVWEQTVATPNGASEVERMVDIDANLIVADGVLFAASYQGKIAALQLNNGTVLWRQPISAYAGLVLVDPCVIVVQADGTINAYNRHSGTLVWQQKILAWRFLTGAAAWQHTLLVGDVDGYLHALDANSGTYLSRVQPTKKPIYSTPAAVDSRLYSLDSDGTLAAVSLH